MREDIIRQIIPHNRQQRLIVGCGLLVFVNVILVINTEMTKYVFDYTGKLEKSEDITNSSRTRSTHQDDHQRPYFMTYIQCSMFAIYLLGFLTQRHWRDQCLQPFDAGIIPTSEYGEEVEMEALSRFPFALSEPEFEPTNYNSDSDRSIVAEPIEAPPDDPLPPLRKKISFAKVHEVRRMPHEEAKEARLSRLPYELWLRAASIAARYRNRIPLRNVLRLAFKIGPILFIAICAKNSSALSSKHASTALSTSISFFTFALAAYMPSHHADRLSMANLLIVMISLSGGATYLLLDQATVFTDDALSALASAFFYALYFVLMRRCVETEEKLEMPLFFGFIGLFTFALFWPGLYILNQFGIERFYPLPTRAQFSSIILSSLIGTVLAEYLILWGVFLTSSLITALSLGLYMPMLAIADNILWTTPITFSFYVSVFPLVLAFLLAAYCHNQSSMDCCVLQKRTPHIGRRGSDDVESSQSLIDDQNDVND